MKGQQKVQEKTANFWGKIFAYENIHTKEQDIWKKLGNTAGREAKRSQTREGKKG